MSALPPGLRPPLLLAAAKAVSKIPAASALPGGSLYEPKWDGFRAALVLDDAGATLWSRQGKNLTGYFPELVTAAEEQVPPGCIVDGEALIWTNDRLDFNSLQQRMITSKAALPAFARERPASFAAFDVLAVAGHDTRAIPLRDRRTLLEELAGGWSPPLHLSPITADPNEAAVWFEEMPATGIEGLVVKGSGQLYEGGVRQWLKVKHRDVLDVVCAAVIGRRDRPSAVVAGLPIQGRLWIVGRTSPLSAAASKALAAHLHIPRDGHPWPDEISSGILDRFSKEKQTVHLTRVEPIVVEVSADVAWSGRSFRHPLRYLRARPELSPETIELPSHLGRA
ncbi:ATP dependent DNA ligase (plasmid) [Pseudarthrobacter chlorophenolicus A6]|uniref:ATP dependent DNA ligase n=1 Tax=Pseudarthrobacter chlorophenolicus (strain ATCC 700700 / DSM 12829 / CIP 107037 / JCM 12360 / KCTC 9906 / NCIMB 13794 / A6) TaxID=452863 RepID=B8HII7_PSECP|nr:ATP-dependent DNA ligase [Pseudarthrobacter chlorophenolicus]ACL42234.1 ATP dependent DNA ligase [Pseudarthrobacter chlorophenolicus A6]SDQ15258.1 ATP dependent DNA ligase domain-containing protein [Pseudarthrobacter chlorophenolicus]